MSTSEMLREDREILEPAWNSYREMGPADLKVIVDILRKDWERLKQQLKDIPSRRPGKEARDVVKLYGGGEYVHRVMAGPASNKEDLLHLFIDGIETREDLLKRLVEVDRLLWAASNILTLKAYPGEIQPFSGIRHETTRRIFFGMQDGEYIVKKEILEPSLPEIEGVPRKEGILILDVFDSSRGEIRKPSDLLRACQRKYPRRQNETDWHCAYSGVRRAMRDAGYSLPRNDVGVFIGQLRQAVGK